MLLFIGGHYLVQHAVLLAEKLGLSPLVISITIVAFGTSAPDRVQKNRLAGRRGEDRRNRAVCWPLFDGANVHSILAGVVLLLVLLGFILFSIFNSDEPPQYPPQDIEVQDKASSSGIKDGVMIILSLLALAFGSRLFVEGAVDLSRLLGVSEAVIGLTVVAVGTAAPELITVAIAAWHKQTDVVIGNILGSNIFNLLAIGGVAALVAPISVDDHFITVDLP